MSATGSGEVRLWREVICQAFTDATSSIRSKDPRNMREAIRLRDEARNWLLGGGTDFRLVCDLALLAADAVRESARRLKRKDWVSPPSQRQQRLADTLDEEGSFR